MAVWAALSAAGAGASPPGAARHSSIIPTPRIDKLRPERVYLAAKEAPVRIAFRGTDPAKSLAVQEGRRLLAERLQSLTAFGLLAPAAKGAITIEKVAPAALAGLLSGAGAAEKLEPRRLKQAYLIRAQPAGAGGTVTVRAAGELGLYYGMVSLCQLIEKDADRRLYAPAGLVADWPAVALRLARTSASLNTPEKVAEFVRWMPAYKINLVGLAFQGPSRNPDQNFLGNVQTHCRRCRRSGVLETIVYFCPFRGAGLDFRLEEDKRQYARLIGWIMDRGAHGVAVDFTGVPASAGRADFEKVLRLTCEGVEAKDPAGYVLFRAPPTGRISSAGPATTEMAQLLSKLPARIWPTWTGPYGPLIYRPLPAEPIEAWAKRAGRRPFLWVNRVFVGGQFSTPVEAGSRQYLFRGDRLPKRLGELTAGVHLSAGTGREYDKLAEVFKPDSIAYLATAADCLWNPGPWRGPESARRARRFAKVMIPLLAGEKIIGPVKKNMERIRLP